jgi:hypothetical protein
MELSPDNRDSSVSMAPHLGWMQRDHPSAPERDTDPDDSQDIVPDATTRKESRNTIKAA